MVVHVFKARRWGAVYSLSNRNLELVFVEGGKPEKLAKNPRSKDGNQQQTQPTYDAESGNRTRATLVGGECSHHCAIPAPHNEIVTTLTTFLKLLFLVYFAFERADGLRRLWLYNTGEDGSVTMS